ncbi:MAG TPA: bifunctional metallophosphatase/5'-nucleotidase, partial [Cupriavidus sp.]|nr:bifunctional metallophosphatase/5'-nucleotidase [Cupriavidus sp.]
MQLHRIQAATLAALLVGVTALAACGSDDTSSSTSGNNGGNSGNSGNGGNNGGNTPAAIVAGTKSTLALLETTDLHTNVLSYDYFKLAEDKSLGFERVSTLI